MGLDVYFYSKKKIKEGCDNTHIPSDLNNIIKPENISPELTDMLVKLKLYSDKLGETLEENLRKAILDYLDKYNSFFDLDGDEVAYFRKFWWILDFFNYSDNDYGQDKVVTKEQIIELRNRAELVIKEVEKYFINKGYEIERSPLSYKGDTSRFCYNKPIYLSFKNKEYTEEDELEADRISYNYFECNDDFIFYKVCELFIYFSKILEETDFEKYQIVLNADW